MTLNGIPLKADKSYLSLDAARDEAHRKLFGQTIWSDVDAVFDALPKPPPEQAPEHEQETYDRLRIAAWSTSWARARHTERLIVGALAGGELETVVFDAPSRSLALVPTSGWRREYCPPRPLGRPFRASPVSPLAKFNGRTLFLRRAQFRRWLRTLDADRSRKGGRRRGRPPLYDWPRFREELASVLEARGVPGPASGRTKWKTRSDLEAYMLSWCMEEWGREPARSTMAPHIDKAISEFYKRR